MVRNLLALDLGPTNRALTRAAAQVSARSGSEIVITHALAGRDFRSAESECLAAAREIQEAGGRVSETLIIRVSPAEDLILTSASELYATLVIMGWGRGQRLGSTARSVLRAAPSSLLMVGEEFAGPLPQGFERISIQDLPPLARLATAARQLALVPPAGGLLVELEPVHSREILSRGVAS